jgi:UTP--glucose-1-phosphate uridylyltransferase
MSTRTNIHKAVFPVAGLGTRFLPATKAQPKEMLPVVDKPLIQYAVEEAYAAGIRHMVFVTGRNKRAIEDHFDTAYELESELEAAGKQELLDLVRSLSPDDMNCSFVRQPRSLGLGHAVLCAQPIVGDEPFAVLLADDLMTGADGGPGVLSQMVEVFGQVGTSVLAVQEVPQEHVRRYGIVAGDAVGERLVKVSAMVEKPAPEKAPSRLAIAARYVITPGIFDCLDRTTAGKGGEVQLTDALRLLLEREPIHGVVLTAKRHDIGNPVDWLKTNLVFAARDAATWAALRPLVESLARGGDSR